MEKGKEFVKEQVKKLYHDFNNRIDASCWKKLFEELVTDENRDEVCGILIDFFDENQNMPQQIWEEIGLFFGWQENQAKLSELYPLTKIQQLCANMYLQLPPDYEKIPSGARAQADEYIKYYGAADRAVMNNQFYKARKNIDRAREINPGSVELLLLESTLYRMMYDGENSQRLADEVLADEPQNEEAWLNKGRSWLMTGELDRAYEALKKAYELAPSHYHVRHRLAACCMSMGKYEEARALYLDLVYGYGYNGDFNVNYGGANHFIIDTYTAKESLTEQEKQSLAESYLYINEVENAVKLAETIEDFMSASKEGCLLQGHIYKAAEAFDRAKTWYEKAIAADDSDARGHYFLGKTMLALHNPIQAAVHYDDALKRNPEYKLPYLPLATVRMMQGDNEGAKTLLRRLMKDHFDYANTCNLFGEILEKEGKPEEAILYYDEAMRTDRNLLDSYLNKAAALRKLERLRESNQVTESALEYGFRDARLYFEKALNYQAAEMDNDALYWLDAAIDEEHPDPEMLFTKAVCLMRLEEFDESDRYFKWTAELDSSYISRIKEATGANGSK